MKASLIFIGVVFMLLGGLFVAIGGVPLLEEWRYQQRGVRVEAAATGKVLRRATDTTDTIYEIGFRYPLPDGRSHARSDRVPVHVWERTAAGAPLTVEYLQNDPSSARVADVERKSVALWLTIGAALVLGGLIAIRKSFTRVAAETESTPSPPPIAVAQEPSYWPLARRSLGFWVGGIFLLVGAPMFLAASFQLYEDVTFPRRASVTNGIVLTKEIKRSGRQNRQSKQYETTYRYAVGATTLEGRDELTFAGWRGLIEREPVDVLYMPRNPSASRVAGPRPWQWKAAFAAFGALFTGIGATFFVGAVRRARLEWRLRQNGVSTPGTIVDLRARNVKINDVQQWRLHYQYRDFRGQAHDKTIDMPEDEALLWKVGDAGTVLYDPAQPTEATWVGRS